MRIYLDICKEVYKMYLVIKKSHLVLSVSSSSSSNSQTDEIGLKIAAWSKFTDPKAHESGNYRVLVISFQINFLIGQTINQEWATHFLKRACSKLNKSLHKDKEKMFISLWNVWRIF